jgi:hypothetical protein
VKSFFLFFVLFLVILQNCIVVYSFFLAKKRYRLELRPRYIRYKFITKEINMGLVYELTCSAPTDLDVVERRLTVTVNGNVVATDSYSNTVTVLGERTFAQGDNVTVSLVDVDDAGNVSEPAVIEFVANDTIAPSVPGLNIQLVREE